MSADEKVLARVMDRDPDYRTTAENVMAARIEQLEAENEALRETLKRVVES